jgi:hypothetical protein
MTSKAFQLHRFQATHTPEEEQEHGTAEACVSTLNTEALSVIIFSFHSCHFNLLLGDFG